MAATEMLAIRSIKMTLMGVIYWGKNRREHPEAA
jgi:hypothetical protein